MERTVNFAAKKLSEKAKEPFLRAWRATNCADIYNGDLATYLNVIAEVLEHRNEQRDVLKDMARDIEKKLTEALLLNGCA